VNINSKNNYYNISNQKNFDRISKKIIDEKFLFLNIIEKKISFRIKIIINILVFKFF